MRGFGSLAVVALGLMLLISIVCDHGGARGQTDGLRGVLGVE